MHEANNKKINFFYITTHKKLNEYSLMVKHLPSKEKLLVRV